MTKRALLAIDDDVEVRLNTEISACSGSEHLEELELRDNQTGAQTLW
jgi:hypothetical protein